MRRGYLDFTAEFASAVDIGTMMPPAWRLVGSTASPFPNVVRLVYENDHLEDGPPVVLTVEVSDGPMSRTIAVTMKDDDDPVPMSAPVRYRLVSDDSGHSYAVPVDRVYEFDRLLAGDSDAPAWALRIDGNFTFTDPTC